MTEIVGHSSAFAVQRGFARDVLCIRSASYFLVRESCQCVKCFAQDFAQVPSLHDWQLHFHNSILHL